jgi:hypothetical protein
MQVAMRKKAQATTVRSAKVSKLSQRIFFAPITNSISTKMQEPISVEAKQFPFGLPSDVWIG